MSTSLTDGTNSSHHAYQHSFQPSLSQSVQTQPQTTAWPNPQPQSTHSADPGGPSTQATQAKQELPAIKAEPSLQDQQFQHHYQKSQPLPPALTTPPTSGQIFQGQSTQQVPSVSGAYHAPVSLANSNRVVADYTGPAQAPPLPLGNSRPAPSGGQADLAHSGFSSQPFQAQAVLNPGPSQVLRAEPNGGTNGKQVSTSDIQQVQNYIEKCLQMYLTQKEVISQLQQQFKIEPCFTQLVWQKLEEQNQEFFRAYYTRLKLKDQIVLFNHLLDEQVKMFERFPQRANLMPASGSGLMPNHSAIPSALPQQPLQQNPSHLITPGMAMGVSQPGNMSHAPPISDANLSLQPEAHQMDVGDFSGLDMDGGSGDLNPDLAALAQSLPFSGSEMNLAGMVSAGSIGRGLGSTDHLPGLPRNFSLSDLGLDHVMDGEQPSIMPRNISLSDFPGLDLDSGGEQS